MSVITFRPLSLKPVKGKLRFPGERKSEFQGTVTDFHQMLVLGMMNSGVTVHLLVGWRRCRVALLEPVDCGWKEIAARGPCARGEND